MLSSNCAAKSASEIYVLLGYGCNFSCRHCVNSSESTRHHEAMTPKDCEAVARSINSDSDVERVTFIGGEPTLYLDLIEHIQGLVRRKVEYAVSGVVSYPEVGVEDALVVVWWGLENSILSLDESIAIKKSWLTRIKNATEGHGNVVALVHHANVRGRHFAERLDFELVGASIRLESA